MRWGEAMRWVKLFGRNRKGWGGKKKKTVKERIWIHSSLNALDASTSFSQQTVLICRTCKINPSKCPGSRDVGEDLMAFSSSTAQTELIWFQNGTNDANWSMLNRAEAKAVRWQMCECITLTGTNLRKITNQNHQTAQKKMKYAGHSSVTE